MQCDQLNREQDVLGPTAGSNAKSPHDKVDPSKSPNDKVDRPKSPNDKEDAKHEPEDKGKPPESAAQPKKIKAPKPGEGVVAVPYDDSSSSERKKKKKKVFVRENKRELSRDDDKEGGGKKTLSAEKEDKDDKKAEAKHDKAKQKKSEEKHSDVFDYELAKTQDLNEEAKKKKGTYVDNLFSNCHVWNVCKACSHAQ
ncbi:hypothetical protein COOONC_26862 [Cooperia oncophora]